VLMLPHHGRENPALGPLVAEVSAQTWIASRGRYRGSGLVEELARRRRAKVWVTAECGAITLRVGAEGEPRMTAFLEP
jgi:beta-lactamase superfamily II metal-dependent hydrolase